MCKALALSALLANSNAKASASAATVFRRASAFSIADNGVPTHDGGTLELQKSNSDPPLPPKLIF